MKYRFRAKKSSVPSEKTSRALIAKRTEKPQRKAPLPEPIETIDFYEFDTAPSERKRKKVSPFLKIRAFFTALSNIAKKLGGSLTKLSARIREKQRRKTVSAIPVISGALCAAILVSSLSAGAVLFGLFYRYTRSYTSLTVPSFVGQRPTDVINPEDSDFNLIIRYEYNEDVEAGLVISQTPRAGVTRRIYGSDEYCNITLTVSRGEEIYTVAHLSGMSVRDAKLALNNSGISAKITEVYSDTVPRGTVIDTSPAEGSVLALGQSVDLRVSAGERVVSATVPSLTGCTEASAAALLSSAGLVLGEVSYESSDVPVGTVLSQDLPAGTSVKKGTAVSISVSAGAVYSPKQVPDLYGMTVQEASLKLREYGIVVGEVFAANGNDPSGTVVAQSPAAGTPITSSTVCVDIYISS